MNSSAEKFSLALGLRRRDPDVLDMLIERYQYRLYRYLLFLAGSRAAAEDVFQETWIRVLEKGGQYNEKFRFETWLFTIARNLVIDRARHQRLSVNLEEFTDRGDAIEFSGAGSGSPLNSLERRELKEQVSGWLANLPALYREALVLRFQEEMSLTEIATVVASPVSTVKSRIYRGLAMLRALLEEDSR